MKVYKAIIYYPETKELLGFTYEKFKILYADFPQVEFCYINEATDFWDALPDADYVFTKRFSYEEYLRATNLKALFVYSAGQELIHPKARSKLRCYFGHFHGKLMAESLVAGMLYFNQQLPKLIQLQKDQIWSQSIGFSQRRLLVGQKVAIIGYGTIGSYCAQLLNSFGVKTYAIQRSKSAGYCKVSGAKFVNNLDLDSLLPDLDHIVSLLPYSEDTLNYFNKAFFTKLAPHAHFYNLGRGHSVNENDLIYALENNLLAGAMLDVVAEEPLKKSSPLWQTTNLLLTPHISAFYQNYVDFYLDELRNQLREELNFV